MFWIKKVLEFCIKCKINKVYKMNRLVLTMGLLSVIVLSACETDTDSLLTTSTTQMTFAPDGGSQVLNVESNTDWSVSTNADWIDVYPMSGNKNQSVTIKVSTTDNLLENKTTIVVRTMDGKKIVNIGVNVLGSLVKTGKYLDIRNHKTRIYLGGDEGIIDSLHVRSNMEWDIRGPEWIEAWDGDRWRPLSKDRGVIRGEGIKYVYIRTARDNTNEDDLEDVITVSEYLSGNYAYEINVSQIGSLTARPNIVATLCNGLAFDWVCGCKVDKIYFKMSKSELENNWSHSASEDNVRREFELTSADYINSVDGMSAGTTVYLSTRCEDVNGIMAHGYNSYTLTTPQSNNLALAPITDAFIETSGLQKGKLKVVTYPNEYTSKYREYATTQSNSAFDYNDPILYYIYIKKLIYKSKSLTGTGWTAWDVSSNGNEIHAMTVAQGMDGKASLYISRYDDYPLGNHVLVDKVRKSMIDEIGAR